MIRKILILAVLLNFATLSYGDYLDGFVCNQDVSEFENLELEYTTINFKEKWYKLKDAKTKFGDTESTIVNYVFVNDKFYGKVCAIIGKENINLILRHFRKEVKRVYAKSESKVFAQPIETKDGAWVFLEPELAITVRRFSLHLGQVEILCRDLWDKRIGLDKINKK